MLSYYTDFKNTLLKFVSDLNRYTPNDGCQMFIKVFDKLEMSKVVLRYVVLMKDHETKLENKDESLFESPLTVFPGIELSELWTKLSKGHKVKIFTYLRMMLIQSYVILQTEQQQQQQQKQKQEQELEESSSKKPKRKRAGRTVRDVKSITTLATYNKKGPADTVDEDKKTDSNQPAPPDFNPFVGVGGDVSMEEYGVEHMYCEITGEIPSGKPKLGLASIGKMLGLDALLKSSGLDLSNISGMLKNIDKEKIDEATNTLKSLLGQSADLDDKTSDMISSLVADITDELGNQDINDDDDPLESIFKIANNVSKRIKPKFENGDIDISKMFKMPTNSTGVDGDAPAFNPMDMIGKMFSQMQQQTNGEQGATGEENGGNPMDMIKNMMSGLNLQQEQNGEEIKGDPMAMISSMLSGLNLQQGQDANNSESANPLDMLNGIMGQLGNLNTAGDTSGDGVEDIDGDCYVNNNV